MKEVIYLDSFDLSKCHFSSKLAITIGAFDGIHLGHMKIFNALINNNDGLSKAVITFTNHPDYSLKKRDDFGLINNESEKIRIFDKIGFDYVIFLDKMFLDLDYNEFNCFLFKINTEVIYLGKDFVYGKGGKGNINTLNNLFKVCVIEDYYYNGNRLSSTLIRNLLSSGNIKELNELLVEPFSISGVVTHGKEIGRSIGFKTANIDYSNKFRLLKHGVYFCIACIDEKEYKAICNFGIKPTIDSNNLPVLEIHILDFDQDIYGKDIKIILKEFHRDEIKFNSLEELKAQINDDVSCLRMVEL